MAGMQLPEILGKKLDNKSDKSGDVLAAPTAAPVEADTAPAAGSPAAE